MVFLTGFNAMQLSASYFLLISCCSESQISTKSWDCLEKIPGIHKCSTVVSGSVTDVSMTLSHFTKPKLAALITGLITYLEMFKFFNT
jgi:hypothetical protein